MACDCAGLHLQMGHASESYGISPGHSTGYILGLLAAITVARQSGFSHREVVSALRPLLEFGATPSVMPAPTFENREVPVLIAA